MKELLLIFIASNLAFTLWDLLRERKNDKKIIKMLDESFKDLSQEEVIVVAGIPDAEYVSYMLEKIENTAYIIFVSRMKGCKEIQNIFYDFGFLRGSVVELTTQGEIPLDEGIADRIVYIPIGKRASEERVFEEMFEKILKPGGTFHFIRNPKHYKPYIYEAGIKKEGELYADIS